MHVFGLSLQPSVAWLLQGDRCAHCGLGGTFVPVCHSPRSDKLYNGRCAAHVGDVGPVCGFAGLFDKPDDVTDVCSTYMCCPPYIHRSLHGLDFPRAHDRMSSPKPCAVLSAATMQRIEQMSMSLFQKS